MKVLDKDNKKEEIILSYGIHQFYETIDLCLDFGTGLGKAVLKIGSYPYNWSPLEPDQG